MICPECLIRCVLLHLLCMLFMLLYSSLCEMYQLSQSFVHSGYGNVSSIIAHFIPWCSLQVYVCNHLWESFCTPFCPSNRSCKTFISGVSAHLRPFCNTPFVANKPSGSHWLELCIKQLSFALVWCSWWIKHFLWHCVFKRYIKKGTKMWSSAIWTHNIPP